MTACSSDNDHGSKALRGGVFLLPLNFEIAEYQPPWKRTLAIGAPDDKEGEVARFIVRCAVGILTKYAVVLSVLGHLENGYVERWASSCRGELSSVQALRAGLLKYLEYRPCNVSDLLRTAPTPNPMQHGRSISVQGTCVFQRDHGYALTTTDLLIDATDIGSIVFEAGRLDRIT